MGNKEELEALKKRIAELEAKIEAEEEEIALEVGERVEGQDVKEIYYYSGANRGVKDPSKVGGVLAHCLCSKFKPRRDLPQFLEFKPWKGGEQPEETKGRVVFVIFRDGVCSGAESDQVEWYHDGTHDDVMWYAIVFKWMAKDA